MSEKIDVLNREEFINKLKSLVEMLANKKQGCCFGIDGAWGSGKSFVLERFEKEIKTILLEETADNKYFVFHYDCWKYDYYDEPAIAIVAAMLDAVDKELSIFSEEVENTGKLALETVKKTLYQIASELCKNKIGIDLVEIASNVLEEHDEKKQSDFNELYGFKKALEETREGIKKIAESKTIVIAVDELDRCLPTYSIKVLERLHHIFTDIDNVVVIISMDKKQLSHSIREIYGDIEVDTYLRKFISFKVNLDNGSATNFFEKYQSYTELFDFTDDEKEEIETFFTNIMSDLNMREQESIFRKAEYIHNIIGDGTKYDCSIMAFEVLYLLTIRNVTKEDAIGLVAASNVVGNNIYANKLYHVIKNIKETMNKGSVNGMYKFHISNLWKHKMVYWFGNIFTKYDRGYASCYYYAAPIEKELNILNKFSEIIEIIDTE